MLLNIAALRIPLRKKGELGLAAIILGIVLILMVVVTSIPLLMQKSSPSTTSSSQQGKIPSFSTPASTLTEKQEIRSVRNQMNVCSTNGKQKDMIGTVNYYTTKMHIGCLNNVLS